MANSPFIPFVYRSDWISVLIVFLMQEKMFYETSIWYLIHTNLICVHLAQPIMGNTCVDGKLFTAYPFEDELTSV